MTDTVAPSAPDLGSAQFLGAPASVLDTPTEPPIPSGTAPTRRAQAKPAKAAAKRAKRATRRPTIPVVDAAADAAATAFEREAAKRGPGRPSKADAQNAILFDGLVNFYVGLGGILQVAGLFLRQQRLTDTGQAMLVQSQSCAKALLSVAEQSPAMRRALEAVALGGGASLVIAAHGPIIAAAMGFGAPAMPEGPQATDPSTVASAQGPDLGSLLGVLLGGLGGEDAAQQ